MADGSPNKIVMILTGVLLLVIAASIGVLLILPGDDSDSLSVTGTDTPLLRDTPPSSTTQSFDLTVTQRQSYQILNKQLVHEGALPVQPPVSTGKANPFL